MKEHPLMKTPIGLQSFLLNTELDTLFGVARRLV